MSTVLWQFVRGDDEHAEFMVLPSTEARAILDAWMEEGTFDMTVCKVVAYFDFAGAAKSE